ncbi:unnamed protein product, partial [Rotaria sp. Silwood1]
MIILLNILEFASQGDLLTYVQRVGTIPEQKRILWSYQLCNAVKYLHELELVHRDLKLENLLLDINDNMKLCDFGFSKDVLKSKEYLSKTYCGSRAYVSPEILLGLPYDAKKADIWAIGVILYIFVTGVMPFKEDKNNQLILKQVCSKFAGFFCVSLIFYFYGYPSTENELLESFEIFRA